MAEFLTEKQKEINTNDMLDRMKKCAGKSIGGVKTEDKPYRLSEYQPIKYPKDEYCTEVVFTKIELDRTYMDLEHLSDEVFSLLNKYSIDQDIIDKLQSLFEGLIDQLYVLEEKIEPLI